MQRIEPLTYGNYYHIYNRGINGCNIFFEPDNYEHFLRLYDKYIQPVADTFAWVLIPNHFHLLVRINDDISPDRVLNPVRAKGFESSNPDRVPNPVRVDGMPSKQFSKLFNSYALAFNKRYSRHGNLFERPFKRKRINSEIYLKQVVIYIHTNPVHHGFCESPMEYPWSSCQTCISVKPSRLKRDTVIGWFDDEANFKYVHHGKFETEKIEQWLEL